MINKKILSLSILLILLMSVGVVFATENSAETLCENSTTIDEPISTEKTFDDLQSKIDSVSENDTLQINGTYKSTGSAINITKAMTIEGSPNATLDADSASRIFAVFHSTNLTLKNLNFINGNGAGRGGAILSNAKLILINCTFINNNAQPIETISEYGDKLNMSTGGAIFCYNPIIATNSEFTNNSANTCGVFYYQGSLTCTDCEFKLNKARTALGIIYIEMGANCILNNCYFENNNAREGMIYCDYAKLTVTNSTFKSNSPATFVLNEVTSANINNNKYKGSYVLNDALKTVYLLKASTNSLKTTYNSGSTLKIKVIDINSGEAQEDYYLKVKVYTGSKYKTYEVVTNSKGIGTFKASKLNVGTHKIEISYYSDYNDFAIKKITTTVKISKAKTTIKAPKVKNKLKKSKYFKVTVKSNKKAVKNTYVKIKIDKKTYKIKTNSKGVAKFNTKKLKKGSHKVTITSGNSNYKMSKKSTIIIY